MAGQCLGHWDFFGSYMVWTRHFTTSPRVRYRVLRYDQLAPEAIPTHTVPESPPPPEPTPTVPEVTRAQPDAAARQQPALPA
jgi:hypothetical protein